MTVDEYDTHFLFYSENSDMVLLVVDTQRGCFNESLYAFETVKEEKTTMRYLMNLHR